MKPNILLILNDDMGYSDLGCYGGEVHTPNLDRLANGGLRFTQFYNTARCSPSRASLLTGLHPHQTGIGILTDDDRPEGYCGTLNERCITIAEVLRAHGYNTYMSGKWHMVHDIHSPNAAWPCQRGFERFYGTIIGAGSYYDPNTLTRQNENIENEAREPDFFYTDAISDNAVRYLTEHQADQPFFMYVAYTAPHWPLHAHAEDVAKYKGRFDAGWDQLREERLARMVDMGLIAPEWQLTDRDPSQPPWEKADDKAWQARRMEVYAAQIDRMDQGIGRIIAALEKTGRLDDTLILFLADNGGCAEEVDTKAGEVLVSYHVARKETRDGRPVRFGNDPSALPGPEDTYQSYGVPWANLSNTPFRLYKHWTHEGGISTPLIVHWPRGIDDRGALRHQPGQLTDIMATVLDVTGAAYPDSRNGHTLPPPEGTSLLPAFRGDAIEPRMMFWEHEGNAAVREGRWKLVREYPKDWELYDLNADRSEMNDLAAGNADRVTQMAAAYDAWAKRCGVIPRELILKARAARAG